MEPRNGENKGTSLQLRKRGSLRTKHWSVKDDIKRFNGWSKRFRHNLILINLTHGSRACAFLLHSALPGNDVKMVQFDSIYATTCLSGSG